MTEKESNVKLTNFLKEETRDAWDKWVVMLAEPYAQSKRVSLPDKVYIEGDHVMCVAADGTETNANDAYTKAYKANSAAQSYLTHCLKHKPELLREAKGSRTTACAMYDYDYLYKKLKSRDPTKLYASIEEDLEKLHPNDSEDRCKFVTKMSLINGDITALGQNKPMNDSLMKVWINRIIHKAEMEDKNASWSRQAS
jgi:hypothetical protein